MAGREVLVVDRYCPPSPSHAITARIGQIIERETVTLTNDGAESEPRAVAEEVIGPGTDLTVALSWTGTSADLDLHGWLTSTNGTATHVYRQDPAHATPKATLSSDVMRSPGREVLLVDVGDDIEVLLAVHPYAGGGLREAEPTVEVSGPGVNVRTVPPASGDGAWWHVGTYDSRTGKFTAFDQIREDTPVE